MRHCEGRVTSWRDGGVICQSGVTVRCDTCGRPITGNAISENDWREGIDRCANGCNWHPCGRVDGCAAANEASTALGWCDIKRTWWEHGSAPNPCESEA